MLKNTNDIFSKYSKLIIPFILVLLSFISTLFFNCTSLLLKDQYIDDQQFFIQGAQHILNGDVLYKTFQDYKGPVQFYFFIPLALLGNLAYSHFIGFIYSCILILPSSIAFYKISSLFLPRYKALLPTTIALFTLQSSYICFQVQNMLGFCVIYFLYIWIKKFIKNGEIKVHSYLLIGLLFALLFWSNPLTLGLPIGLILWTLVLKRSFDFFKGLIISFISFLISSFLILLYFIVNNALSNLIECLMLSSKGRNLNFFHSFYYAFEQYFTFSPRTIITTISFVLFIVCLFAFNEIKNFRVILFLSLLTSISFAFIPKINNSLPYYNSCSNIIFIFGLIYLTRLIFVQNNFLFVYFLSSLLILTLNTNLFILSNPEHMKADDYPYIRYKVPLAIPSDSSNKKEDTLTNLTFRTWNLNISKDTTNTIKYSVPLEFRNSPLPKLICDYLKDNKYQSMLDISTYQNRYSFTCNQISPWQMSVRTHANDPTQSYYVMDSIKNASYQYLVVADNINVETGKNLKGNDKFFLNSLTLGYKVLKAFNQRLNDKEVYRVYLLKYLPVETFQKK